MNWPTNLFYQECLKTVKKYKEEHSYNLTFWTSFKSRSQPITSAIITPGTFCRGKNGELPFHFNGIPTRILRLVTRSCEWRRDFPYSVSRTRFPPSMGTCTLPWMVLFADKIAVGRLSFTLILILYSFVWLFFPLSADLLWPFQWSRGPTLSPLKKCSLINRVI